MMQSFFSRLLWAFILLVFQGLVFNHIHFFRLCYPVIYVYILCLQPLNTALCVAVVGICSRARSRFFFRDAGSGGCVHDFDGLVRSATFLRLFTPKDCLKTWCRGYRTLGGWNYIWYVTLLVLLQQASVMMLLKFFLFFSALDMLYIYLSSSALSIVLILVLERMRGNK